MREMLKFTAHCNKDVAEGASVMFKIFREGMDTKRDKPVAELEGFNHDGKAAVSWEPIDCRETEDRTELRYFFTVETWRAPVKQSGLIPVVNPQVLEMRWEPEFIYQGDKAKLHITTFETSDSSPTVKVQFWLRGKSDSDEPILEIIKTHDSKELKARYWEHGRPDQYRMIYESETAIDKNEIEVTFDSSQASPNAVKGDYQIQTKIICDSFPLNACKHTYLTVGASTVRE